MTTQLIVNYLAYGLASARPTTPTVSASEASLYYATDTNVLSLWDGAAWVVVGGSGGAVTSIIAGAGLTGGTITSSGTIALSVPVTLARGGTDADLSATGPGLVQQATSGAALSLMTLTNGQIPIGSTGSVPSAGTITAGTGISITNAAGAITITNAGSTGTVTSVDITVPASSLLGVSGVPITTSGTATITTTGSVGAIPYFNTANTLNTTAPLTKYGIVLGGGTAAAPATTAAPTDGQLLIGYTGKAPVLNTLSAGANVTITNAAGAITIGVSGVGTGTVTEVDTGTNLTGGPITTTGTISDGPLTTVAKTANYPIVAADVGKTFTNTGAAGEVDFTLPAWASGLWFRFMVTAAQIMKIILPAANTLYWGVNASSAAGNIASPASIGPTLMIAASDASGVWMVDASEGPWTLT